MNTPPMPPNPYSQYPVGQQPQFQVGLMPHRGEFDLGPWNFGIGAVPGVRPICLDHGQPRSQRNA